MTVWSTFQFHHASFQPFIQSQPIAASRWFALLHSENATTKPSFFSWMSLISSALHHDTLMPFPPLDSLQFSNNPLHKSQPSYKFDLAPKYSPPLDAFEYLQLPLHISPMSIPFPISVLLEFSTYLKGKVQSERDGNVRIDLGKPNILLKLNGKNTI